MNNNINSVIEMSKPKLIAFYLPQYHPTLDNDKWWGKGFTEWTNVGKAKPLFIGHYQPKVPADLGYYDLRVPEVRELQASLAKEAGIYGFCYYHYWFGNGRKELELPFAEVLKSEKPNFPFCLCWANESWHSKFWNKDGSIEKKILIEQLYPGDDDIINHFNYVLPAFKDPRYIKVGNSPLFMVYNPLDYADIRHFISLWNELAKQNGFNGVYFICQLRNNLNQETYDLLRECGFKAINTMRLWEGMNHNLGVIKKIKRKLINIFIGIPRSRQYKDVYPYFLSDEDAQDGIYPSLIPNWDHTPRSGKAGSILINANPDLFEKHAEMVLNFSKINNKDFVFIKSWNEWGEGNYMEPDLKYGKGFIEALRRVVDKVFTR
ncbi:glycoside hydrolase family 99-like domain-containing protein [Phocaeicola dorei]|jgi:lipopolysaccharide biosynthesis protein|uniref:Glycoside hydrolase family 99-like domain-containing protein n=2 Tax=Phocaeicola dorei TaxID=357276 RepID=A0AA95HPZ5_9BACT|nr:glycoside hydrolase family 99-like domain-containing protein [Phocaeicola dorei]WHX08549.1 glycoside hydrolase family 99-like domain-containing protein [Phocaeicola dorei]